MFNLNELSIDASYLPLSTYLKPNIVQTRLPATIHHLLNRDNV